MGEPSHATTAHTETEKSAGGSGGSRGHGPCCPSLYDQLHTSYVPPWAACQSNGSWITLETSCHQPCAPPPKKKNTTPSCPRTPPPQTPPHPAPAPPRRAPLPRPRQHPAPRTRTISSVSSLENPYTGTGSTCQDDNHKGPGTQGGSTGSEHDKQEKVEADTHTCTSMGIDIKIGCWSQACTGLDMERSHWCRPPRVE